MPLPSYPAQKVDARDPTPDQHSGANVDSTSIRLQILWITQADLTPVGPLYFERTTDIGDT